MGATCNNPQAIAFAETIKVLAKHEPTQHAWLESLPPHEWMELVTRHAWQQTAQEGEPFFKPRPPNQNIACYLLADLNFAQNHAACQYISDPVLRADCEDKARDAYCNAIEACGGVK